MSQAYDMTSMNVSSGNVISVSCAAQKNPPGGHAARGNESTSRKMDYGALTNFFHAANKLFAFTEPRPLAKLQPACAAKAAVVLL
jgi:hypothetical protein